MIGLLLQVFANSQPYGLQHFSAKETSFQVFLFGGIFNETYQNDLWVFDSGWEIFSTSIDARIKINMWRTPMDEVYMWSGRREDYTVIDDCWLIKNGTDISRLYFEGTDPFKRFSSLVVSSGDNVYIFGGIFIEDVYLFNDFWHYSISENSWMLISGVNVYNDYFVNSELPASRGRSMGWMINEVFYMYGGYNNELLGDFWKYNSTWELIHSNGQFGPQENLCSFMIDDNIFMFVNGSELWNFQTRWTYEIYAPSCYDFVFQNNTTFYTIDSNFTFIDLYTYVYQIDPDDDDDTTIDNDDDTTVDDDDDDNLKTTTVVVTVVAASLALGVAVVVIALCCCCFVMILKRKRVEFDEIAKLENQETARNIANIKINKDLFKLNYDSIEIVKKLGKGAYATVFLAEWSGHQVAFKCFNTSDVFNDEKNNFNDFEKEVAILSSIGHPNIIGFYGATLKPPRVGLVIEFGSNGDIKDYLTKHTSTTVNGRIDFVLGITKGMCYLHDKGIIHRDLKCENVLLDKHLTPKITDFGVSKIFNNEGITKTQKVGTGYYMAPEVCKGSDYDDSCDVFSFSIVMFEIFSGDFNPYGNTLGNVEMKVAMDPEYRPDINKIPDDFEKAKGKIVEGWNDDPLQRPTFDELATFFKEFNQ